MNKSQLYIKKAQASAEEIKADLYKMRAKAKQLEVGVQLEYLKTINSFESERKKLMLKLSGLMKNGIDASGDLRRRFENAWESLKDSIDNAKFRFEEYEY